MTKDDDKQGDPVLGARIRELRARAGLTQDAVAEKAGIPRGTLANLEQGRRSPTWKTITAIADVLGVKVDDFRQTPGDAEPSQRGRPAKK